MNNNYFYKLASIADRIDWMRKVAQTTDPTTQAPAAAPTTTAPTPSTPNTTASTTSTPESAPTNNPTPSASQPGMVGYRPKTPEDLVNHWVAQKEHYYRNRTDKFADRYKDYTVSPEAKRLMEREANKIWTEIGSDPSKLEASHLEREGAFNTAMDRDARKRIERKQKQEQAAEAPMQNPIATSAISNPPPGPTWTSENDRFNQAMAASNNSFWNYYDPRIQTPGFNRYNAYRAAALAPFYSSSYTASKVNQAFNDELMANGLHFSNDPDVNTLWKAYQDAWSAHDYSDQFPATAPKDAALDKQNLAFWNAINLPTGDVRSPAQLVDHLRESDPKLQTMPGGWDPNVWQALVNLYSRMKKV